MNDRREGRQRFIEEITSEPLKFAESERIAAWLKELSKDLVPAMLAAFDGGLLNDEFTERFDQGPNSNREFTNRAKLRDLGLVTKFPEFVEFSAIKSDCEDDDRNRHWRVVPEATSDSEKHPVNYLTPLGEEFVDAFKSIPIRAPAAIADDVSGFLLGLPMRTRVSGNEFVPNIYRLALKAKISARRNPDPLVIATHQSALTDRFKWASAVRIFSPWPPTNDVTDFTNDVFGTDHRIVVGYSYLERYNSAADINVNREQYAEFYADASDRDTVIFSVVPGTERFPYLLALFEDQAAERQELVIWGRGNPNDSYSVVVETDDPGLYEWGENLFETIEATSVPFADRL